MATHNNTTPSRKDNTLSHFPSDLNSFEHASPTKALFQSRLNNDIASITAWLESLLSPTSTTPLPTKFLSWREEVNAASSSSQLYPAIGNSTTTAHGGDDGSKILESLKALRQVNLLADHLRSLVQDARLEALEELEGRIVFREQLRRKAANEERRSGSSCAHEIYTALDGSAKGALEELQTAAALLDLDVGGLPRSNELDGSEEDEEGALMTDNSLMGLFAREILNRAYRRLVLEGQLDRLRGLLRSTRESLEGGTDPTNLPGQAEREIRLGASAFEGASGRFDESQRVEQLQAETAKFTRDAKQINLKILEYQDRITGLQKQLSRVRAETVSIEDVLSTRKRVEERSNTVKDLENRIKAFHGLPPDLSASRMEIRRATLELEESKRKREELFERISTLER